MGQRARVIAIDWTMLEPDEVQRLQGLGIEVGARLAVAHRGIFGGRDPIAVAIGRMTVALRRSHARAMAVELV